MSVTNKSLRCINCGNTFTFTAEVNERFEHKGNVYEPKHCLSCGHTQTTQNTIGSRYRRKIYPAVCAGCGKDTIVPFEPSDDVPVYCSSCYSWAAQSRY
jgi:CxxC-x17-CxxC domain-containing protein